MNMPILSVKGLMKYFPIYEGIFRRLIGEFKAVDGISFSINPGTVLGMVGESGSGKSTAARCAIKLITPTAGEILFLGQRLDLLPSKELIKIRKEVQMVFQDPYGSLNPRKTILEAISEGILFHHIVSTHKEAEEETSKILRLVGMNPDVMTRYPHEFSGGQQQRICIGRAIAVRPRLLICDEAISALDVSIQAQILNLLIDLKEELNLSYLFITHDLSVIRHIADEVVVLQAGKIVEQQETEQLFENPHDEYTKTLLSAIPRQRP